MSTESRRRKKRSDKARKEGMKAFTVLHDCGCCRATLYFISESRAEKALEKAGLGNGKSIVDDMGTVHEKLDTFYGIIRVDSTLTG